MNRTGVVFSQIYYRHNPGKNHPESAQRLQAIIHELKHGRLANSKNWQFVDPEKATIEDVELAHGIEYIRLVEAVCKSGGGLLDLQDTEVSPESFDVALHAVGGTLKAVDLVMNGEFENAFALIRPPGHHASKYRACGFCLFNNIAIAAKHLTEHYGLQRVLILDVDAHHGNGTQETFYDTSKVLFVSLHEDPRSFPGTGFVDEVGRSEGLGYTVNIPLPFRTGNHIYLRAMDEIVTPIALQYEPQFVLVSAGFDGHHTDSVGNLTLTTSCHQQIFEVIMEIAEKKCRGRIVSALEGGYNTKTIGTNVATAIAAMCRTPYMVRDRARTSDQSAERKGEKALRDAKRVQKAFWRID